MSATVVLFACSKCFSRHPFEELSTGQQLCKECRGTFPIVKCTYCRSEFQQTSKGNTSTICKKCEYNVKAHGKPTACEYCNIIAAFIGSKCQRCTNAELQYGPAVTCDQCKQRCAFDRHDENKKIDGKLICWLCSLSYKRAVAKARQTEPESRMAKKRPSSNDKPSGGKEDRHKKQSRSDSNSTGNGGGGGGNNSSGNGSANRGGGGGDGKHSSLLPDIPEKIVRGGGGGGNHSGSGGGGGSVDQNSSEHVVAMTNLKEQIASLQKKLMQKDRELLTKDKFMTELKSKNFISENELRTKMKDSEKYYETKVEVLNKKVAGLLKEVAQLAKVNKRAVGGGGGSMTTAGNGGNAIANGGGGGGGSVATITVPTPTSSSSGKESGGSGTDSPNTN